MQQVGHPASARRAGHAGELHEGSRGEASHGEAEMEAGIEVCGHPAQQDERDEVRADECAHQQQHRRRTEEKLQRRQFFRAANGNLRLDDGMLHGAAARLLERP